MLTFISIKEKIILNFQVKYQKDNSKKKSINNCDENYELNSESIDSNEKNTSTLITVVTDTLEIDKIKSSNLSELKVTNISSKVRYFYLY